MASSNEQALNAPFTKDKRARDKRGLRACAHEGCMEEGLYRAPLHPQRLDLHQWLCLEHVRAFNASWNYFAGLDEEAIDRVRRADSTWGRPTWQMGQGRFCGPNPKEKEVEEAFSAFQKTYFQETKGFHGKSVQKALTEEERALASLDLEPPSSLQEVKARYKDLVKRLHPDTGKSDPESEEKLKEINLAYAKLKRWFTE